MFSDELLQHFPLQLLSRQDLLVAVEQAAEGVLGPSPHPGVAAAWPELLEGVRHALVEGYLYGPSVRSREVQRVEELLARLEQPLDPDPRRQLRFAYVTLLDRIYGALFLQVVRNAPTATYTPDGHFSLAGLYISRQARLPHGERSPLDALLHLLEEGAFRLDLDFAWRPLGATAAGEPPRPARRH